VQSRGSVLDRIHLDPVHQVPFRFRSRVSAFCLAAVAGVTFVTSAAAQPADTGKISTAPLFTRRDALVGAGIVALTVGTMQYDHRIQRWLRQDRFQRDQFLHDRAGEIKLVNERSLFAISAASYVVGRLGRVERLADVGLHAAEAIVITSAAATILKSGLGRSRPFVTDAKDAFDFDPGKGWDRPDYRSFPSLHEGGSFAAAAVFTAEVDRWRPGAGKVAGPVFYAAALLPGIARMYSNKHWASDVILGGAIGTFAGIKTVRYHHSHPGNRIDKWLLDARVQPGMGEGPILVMNVRF
jgi:PAP2 superfamily protein